MTRQLMCSLVLLTVACSSCSAEEVRVQVELSPEAWRQDLDQLAHELPRRHVRSFHRVTEDNWRRSVEALTADLAQADDATVILGMTARAFSKAYQGPFRDPPFRAASVNPLVLPGRGAT